MGSSKVGGAIAKKRHSHRQSNASRRGGVIDGAQYKRSKRASGWLLDFIAEDSHCRPTLREMQESQQYKYVASIGHEISMYAGHFVS